MAISRSTIFVSIVGIALIFGSIHYFRSSLSNKDQYAILDESEVTEKDITSLVEANNLFALDLYNRLSQDGGNVFFSPFSVSTALSMTYEGARGETAEQMQRVFHFNKNTKERLSANAAVLNKANKSKKAYQFLIANSLWLHKDYLFLDDYLGVVRKYYGAELSNVDFVGQTETARNTINDWVDSRTNRKIKELFPAGTINSYTRMVLTNAIYFKGAWADEFDADSTIDEDFFVSDSITTSVPMMHRGGQNSKYNYTENTMFQVLELPYKGNELSMLVLLPQQGNSLSKVEHLLTAEHLYEWRQSLQELQVDVVLPKFTFDSKFFLNDVLTDMGMPSAFSEGADFSGIDGSRDLFIHSVLHQAFIEVNEEGTEAAAATGVGFGVTSFIEPQAVFRADRPFIFLIQDRETGNIYFVGRVENPKN
jgi:serpin B